MRKKSLRIHLAAFLTATALVAVTGVVKRCEPYRKQEIYFSEEERFLEEDVELKLSTLFASEIYYTLDGSEPSDQSRHYEGSISLKVEEECRGVPIRAIAYYKDGNTSEICTQTYLVGKNVKNRFSTIVVEITGDPEELLDYETGILVTGKLRDDYVMEHPDEKVTDSDPANYNIRGYEGERQIRAEIWEPDGTVLLSQDLGIRVNGGLSRGLDVKSLRLIAREQYGEKRIMTTLFSEEDKGENPYFPKRLLLRNHGNDQEYGYLRNELGQALATDAGFPCVQRFCPASVWINGEYYGFEWLEEYFDNAYLDELYQNKEKGTWGIAEPYRESSTELSEEEQRAKSDLEEVMAYAQQDLTEDASYQELASRLDIDNFLRYCAVEICVANADWPTNNCKAYRWYSDTDTYEEERGIDGRWRFALYDLDMSMGRITETAYDTRSLALALGVEHNGWKNEFPLLKALLQRQELRTEFTGILETYLDGAFSAENAKTRMAEIEDGMAGELTWQIQTFAEKEAAKSGEDYESVYGDKRLMHEYETDVIREFWEERGKTIREEMRHLDEYLTVEED